MEPEEIIRKMFARAHIDRKETQEESRVQELTDEQAEKLEKQLDKQNAKQINDISKVD